MSEAILPVQAIQQEDRQTNDWSPAKVTYAVLMAVSLLSHIWLMLIGAGIDNIPIYIWIIRLLPVPFAICLGKLWKDRGFQILSVYFLWFFLRCFIPNPGSIFSVEVAESIPGALWLFAGCYGLAKILAVSQLKRFLSSISIIWVAVMAVLCCLGIYMVWTERPVNLLGGEIKIFLDPYYPGIRRLELIYLPTTAGAMLSITVLIGTILALSTNNRIHKIALLLMLVPVIIAMALTDSRTAFVSVSAGLAIMAFTGIYQYSRKRTSKKEPNKQPTQWKTWFLGILVMAVVFLLLIIILLQITPAFNRIRTQGVIPRALAEETEKTDIAARGFSGARVLTGRAELWTRIFNYIDQNRHILLNGMTKQGPLTRIDSFFGHSHCLYIQVLLESGIPGLLLVLVFIVYTAINAIRAITNPALPLWIRLLPAVFASMAVADLVECFLWLRATQAPMPAVFFITAGILNTLVPKSQRRNLLPKLQYNKPNSEETMLYDNKQWISDIDKVSEVLPELNTLAGKSILITGAAGLICSSVVDILFRYNDTHPVHVQIYAAGRWLEEMEARFHDQIRRPDFHFVVYDASKTDNVLDCPADYIIHGASNAHPALIVKEPVETMMSNFLGMKYLLDYAKDHESKRILYISSSEVYGNKPGDQPFKEGEYGYIDLLNSRNSYSVGKRAAETLCASYAAEYGVESVIVRPGHIYGPTASPNDNRVSSAWAFQAAKGEDIVMKSNGAQIRSYCYCLDCASAMLKVLLSGENCHAYNISNPDSIINIKQMAEILAAAGRVKLKMELPTETEKKSFNPMANSSLESQSLINLGWCGCFNAEEGLGHTVAILKSIYGY